jgi:hypothetical protein
MNNDKVEVFYFWLNTYSECGYTYTTQLPPFFDSSIIADQIKDTHANAVKKFEEHFSKKIEEIKQIREKRKKLTFLLWNK